MGCFVLPQEVYEEPELRATFTGIAAAAGKLGAVLGIWLFEALTPEIGVVPVMGVVAAFALLAARLSHTCISDELWERQRRQMAAQALAQQSDDDDDDADGDDRDDEEESRGGAGSTMAAAEHDDGNQRGGGGSGGTAIELAIVVSPLVVAMSTADRAAIAEATT